MRLILPLHGATLLAMLFLTGCASSTVSERDSSVHPLDQAILRPVEQPEPLGTSSLEAYKRSGENFAHAGVNQTDSSSVKEVYFDFDSYVLTPAARAALKANAEWLRNHSSLAVMTEGHADERGTNEYNVALGARRAQVTMEYLSVLGISSERLSTTSYGEELPVCGEKTEECWQRNRRVRFVMASIDSASLP